jgi:hypothetical protein
MSEQRSGRLGVELHGVRLNLTCNDDLLLRCVADVLDGATRPWWNQPDLAVNGTWRTEPLPDKTSAFEGTPAWELGKRMRLGADDLVWFDTHRDKDLQLRFRREGAVRVFDVDYCFRPSAEKLAKHLDYRVRKFFTLTRYLVHFPIAWHLARTRGWSLMHASAVAAGDRAVLVAGLGGSGKTTTCVALMAQAGMTLVTENLLFSDGEAVFPLAEPIRLTDDSLALLTGRAREALVPMDLRGASKGKTLFRLPAGATERPVRPAAIFFPQFAEQSFVRPIPAAIACELLAATNRLALELNNYEWYTAPLDLLWPAAGHVERQLHVLRRLTSTAPCYVLGIDRAAGVSAVVDTILHCLGWVDHAMGEVAP